VLKNLAKQDKRYEIDKKNLGCRVRVDKDLLKKAQDDSSVVFSTPFYPEDDDLPFVLSFKLEEGKLAPSPSKFAIEEIDTSDVTLVN